MKRRRPNLINSENKGRYSIKRLNRFSPDAGFYETTIPKGEVVINHYHPNLKEVLYFFTDADMIIENENYSIEAGDYVYLEKGEEHEISALNNDVKLMAIKFPDIKKDKVITLGYEYLIKMLKIHSEPQFIIMMHGLTGVGKSTLSKYIAKHIPNTKIIHTAIIRQELGLTDTNFEFSLTDEIFVKDISPSVYRVMISEASRELSLGNSIILDGSFSMKWQRELVYNYLIKKYPFYIFHCICKSESEIKQRIKSRENLEDVFSEASNWKTYLSLKKHSDPIEKDGLFNGNIPTIIPVSTG